MRSIIQTDVEDPQFLAKIFSYIAKKRKRGRLPFDAIERVCLEEYLPSDSVDAGGFQEGCSIRITLRSRQLAKLLIDDMGLLNRPFLRQAIDIISQHTYFIGPGREHDACRMEHLLQVLRMLEENKELSMALQKIQKPHLHPIADQIIRDTLQIAPKIAITHADARRAALSALLCYLRQALGSCFATAPAIIVHEEQPLRFLADVSELLNTGKIKRTFSGVEYSVPLCHSWGWGDLKRFFYVPGDPEKGAEQLCRQPGFVAAMKIEGGTSTKLSLKENRKILKKMIKEVLKEKGVPEQMLLMIPEEMIKQLLLRHFSLTEEQLIEFEKPSQTAFFSPFALQGGQASSSLNSREQKEAFLRYKMAFERACGAFKALTENGLLRAWEYSLASFAETKAEFAKWNLYASLGLKPEERGGVGECLWRILQQALAEYNKKVEDHQFEYEQMAAQLKIRENRLRQATSEEEVRWLKIDYRAKAQELGVIQELRDQAYMQAQKIAHLFDWLIDFYLATFPDYFQEVYDPEMVDVSAGPYDDSPAGFRLIYKHGRVNTAQWTPITTPDQFIESLANFFMSAERSMSFEDKFKGLERLLAEITTEVVGQLRTKEFMETALARMAVAHGVPLVENPLENLERVEKKPWVYTSGGSLHTLVSMYFRRGEKPTAEARWVESPQELLIFLVDVLKKMPAAITADFIVHPHRSLLTHSPTHAFLLKPGAVPFVEGWNNELFSYTWVRDQWLIPMERAVQEIIINPDMMQSLVKRLLPQVPPNQRHYFHQCFSNLQGSMSAPMFRNYLVYTMENERGLQHGNKPVLDASFIDSILFENLPYFPIYKLQENVERVLSNIPDFSPAQVDQAVHYADVFSNKVWGESVMGAKQFQQVCKGLITLVSKKTSFPINYHRVIKKKCEQEKLSLPQPIIFADSNWVKDLFAFLINPGTGKLELWRVNPLGSEGMPMAEWSHWLDGSRKRPDWGVFINPFEYVG